jgi:hypothetical protein
MIKEYIINLDRETIIQLIRDYEQFERDGMIGDCELRRRANSFQTVHLGNVVMFMERLAFEAYRRIAGEVL